MIEKKHSINVCSLFAILLAVYFFLGKLKIFTIAGISTDYLFWIVLFAYVCFCTVVHRYIKKISTNQVILLVYLLFQCYEMLRGNHQYSLYVFVFNVLTIIIFMFISGKSGFEKVWFKCLYTGGLYYTISVILQALIPSVLNPLRQILLTSADYTASQRGYENTTTYLSGLASNSAVAAFFIAVFCAIVFGRFINGYDKKKNFILFVVGILSLLLTQKRTLILSVFIAIFIIYATLKKGLNRKIRFILIGGAFLAFFGILAVEFVPAVQILINRFFNNTDLLSGRESYYDVMIEWFNNNKLFGHGIGSANELWGYGGHNCYLQLLGETGIIGCLIYAFMVIPMLYRVFSVLRYMWNDDNVMRIYPEETNIILSTGIICVIILLYALTGNPFYDFTFCLTWFTMFAVPSQLPKEIFSLEVNRYE